jgi:hypothetical protein
MKEDKEKIVKLLGEIKPESEEIKQDPFKEEDKKVFNEIKEKLKSNPDLKYAGPNNWKNFYVEKAKEGVSNEELFPGPNEYEYVDNSKLLPDSWQKMGAKDLQQETEKYFNPDKVAEDEEILVPTFEVAQDLKSEWPPETSTKKNNWKKTKGPSKEDLLNMVKEILGDPVSPLTNDKSNLDFLEIDDE